MTNTVHVPPESKCHRLEGKIIRSNSLRSFLQQNQVVNRTRVPAWISARAHMDGGFFRWYSSRFSEIISSAMLVLLVIIQAGCATSPNVPSVRVSPLPTLPLAVVFQPGDVVEINFQYWPDMNQIQTIRPDGIISLPLVHEVRAADRSPEELREWLLEAYADKLKDPEILVIARVEQNRVVHVGGEVELTRNTDGLVAIPIIGRLTIWEAIIKSGGILNRSAKISNVLVIRRIGDTQYARTVDLRGEFKNAETEAFYLQANDIVYVPRTKIDRVDQWVDQYLNQTIPAWLQIRFDPFD